MARETKAQKAARLAEEAAEAEENNVTFTPGDSLMVDLNEVEDASFELMPRAKYNAQIVECEFEVSQSGGNPMWSMRADVDEGDYEGRALFLHWVWAGKGLPFTKKQAARIAPELLEEAFDPQDEGVIESMIGRRITLKVSTRKYEGEMRNNVTDVFALEEGEGFMA